MHADGKPDNRSPKQFRGGGGGGLQSSFLQVPIQVPIEWTEACHITPLHMASSVTRASVTHPSTNRARRCVNNERWHCCKNIVVNVSVSNV